MSGRYRYFPNPYPDYDGSGAVNVDNRTWMAKCMEIIQDILEHRSEIERHADGGVYVGPAGVAFSLIDFCQQIETSPESSNRKHLLDVSGELLKCNLNYLNHPSMKRDTTSQRAFLLGAPGVFCVSAYYAKVIGDLDLMKNMVSKYDSTERLLHNMGDTNSDELFVGRAGYVMGSLWLHNVVDPVVPEGYHEAVQKICHDIIVSGKRYSQSRRSRCPLMYSYYETEYLGAAHGLSSILQALLSVPYCSAMSIPEVKMAVDFMVSLQSDSGNIPSAMDEVAPHPQRTPENELIHWCHGAPGVVYLFVKAFLVWNDEKYIQAALRCGDCVWSRGLLRKGPGICHGVAGSGFVFLVLFRLTGDQKHLYRATKFAEFLNTREFMAARKPDCPWSLYEGTAGTLCFLIALMNPSKASFPFFDVFT